MFGWTHVLIFVEILNYWYKLLVTGLFIFRLFILISLLKNYFPLKVYLVKLYMYWNNIINNVLSLYPLYVQYSSLFNHDTVVISLLLFWSILPDVYIAVKFFKVVISHLLNYTWVCLFVFLLLLDCFLLISDITAPLSNFYFLWVCFPTYS